MLSEISSVLLPSLLDKIFQTFSICRAEDKEALNLFWDLHNVLGKRLVSAALHVLDNHSIVIYTSNELKTLELAEIYEAHPSFRLVRLSRHLNYCTCEYFQQKVLNKQSKKTGPYTCHHVLALRLAIALQHKCLQLKKVPNNKLDSLLNYFLSHHTATD